MPNFPVSVVFSAGPAPGQSARGTGVRYATDCSVRNDKQSGVDDRMSYESEPVTAKAVPIERGTSGSENEVTTPLEGEKAARKGYNPEMAFNYDEHVWNWN